MKSDFQSCQGVVQMSRGPKQECHNASSFETEIKFDVGDLRKKYLTRCHVSS